MFKRSALAAASVLALAIAPSASASVISATPIAVTAGYQGVTSGDHIKVEYFCQATAGPTAVSISITRCGIDVNHGQAFSGPAGIIRAEENVYRFPFALCWAAEALFPDLSKNYTSGCTTKSLLDVGFGESHSL